MEVVVTNAKMSAAEQQHYIQYVSEKYPHITIQKLMLTVDGDTVKISIVPKRSILTKMGGTSIGDPLFWNDAKRAEYFDTIPNRICASEE